jgi:Domain of unknown function (DUF4160)
MPTIFREDGFRIVIFTDDHMPPHVHIFKSGAEVKIELIEPKIIKVEGKISSKDVVRAYDLVVDRQLEFLEKWEEIHGK